MASTPASDHTDAMDPLLKKLQFKEGRLTVLGAPAALGPVISGWADEPEVAKVANRLGKHETFVLCFVQSPADIARQAPRVAAALPADGVVWFAYPKKSSPQYNPELSRDDGWQPLGDAGWEPVRQVAVDEQWSAVRFRRVEFIETMTRGRAMSAEGKRRISR
jgi:hypothetical protein